MWIESGVHKLFILIGIIKVNTCLEVVTLKDIFLISKNHPLAQIENTSNVSQTITLTRCP